LLLLANYNLQYTVIVLQVDEGFLEAQRLLLYFFFSRTRRRVARHCIKLEKEYNAKEWLQCLSATTANQKISHHNRYDNNYKDMPIPARAKGRPTSATTKE
jgi:hypothetical protein